MSDKNRTLDVPYDTGLNAAVKQLFHDLAQSPKKYSSHEWLRFDDFSDLRELMTSLFFERDDPKTVLPKLT